jgi:hypothetical protein
MSWRDHLAVHPAADLFPKLHEGDLVALGEDIKRNGLSSPVAIQIKKNGEPVLLDGRNRLDAMERIGLRVRLEKGNGNVGAWKLLAEEQLDGKWVGTSLAPTMGVTVVVLTTDPVAYITSINIHRRHLLPEVKRDLIAELLRENPERSDRATAELAKVDHKTIAAMRRREEQLGRLPQLKTRKGKDGKSRPTAASKRSKPKKAASTIPDSAITTPTVESPHPKSDAVWTHICQTAHGMTAWATNDNIGLVCNGLKRARRSAPQEANIKAVRDCAAIFAKIVSLLDGETCGGSDEQCHAVGDEVESEAQPGDGLDLPKFLDRRVCVDAKLT